MGVGHVIENHYLKPERWFERGLFRELERRGFRFAELNEPGAGTLHYDVKDLAANTNMGEWVPRWCFWWIEWALKDYGGRCSLKLDWFAGRGVEPDTQEPPRVVGRLRGRGGEVLSDHDPICSTSVCGRIDKGARGACLNLHRRQTLDRLRPLQGRRADTMRRSSSSS
jgi:hypothetical protein